MIPDTPDIFFRFIEDNANEDIARLRLKYHGHDAGFDIDFAILQIECRQKCSVKLKRLASCKEVLFPSALACEQASHQAVAQFHATLAKGAERVIDMTAGLGIDAMEISRNATATIACELDPDKAEALLHNKQLLGLDSLSVVNCDSVRYLEECDSPFNLIFIDPARRGEGNKRVYNFRDCQPDILANTDLLLSKGERLMIKASPLLDISQTLKDVDNVFSIRAVSVNGECKEILVEASRGRCNAHGILAEAIDLDNNGTIKSRFSYKLNPAEPDSEYTGIEYADTKSVTPGMYLYEPNAPVMKLAPWKSLTVKYPSLRKLAPSSHLFVSEEQIADFPGRKLQIKDVPDRKSLKSLKGERLNVVSRNYPLSAAEIRKKYGLREGTDSFFYATKSGATPFIIIAERIPKS